MGRSLRTLHHIHSEASMRADICNIRTIGFLRPISGPKRMEAQDFVSNNQGREKAGDDLFSPRSGIL